MSSITGAFAGLDELGPTQVATIAEQRTGLRAIVVLDNLACGPAIGGVRIAEDATLDECRRLARAMTLKSAAASLPHGGAKSVIIADPHMPGADKEELTRAFACAIRDLRDYVPGPDMGTDERAMAWIHDEIGRAIGKPAELGGIPLDEIGVTGFGVAVATEVAAGLGGFPLQGARVAVQGFGAVGTQAARFLSERGCLLVAVSDSQGMTVNPSGLDVEQLLAHKRAANHVATFDGGVPRDRENLVDVECEIWIPAARPDALRADNAHRLRARLVVEGANIPVTSEADGILHERGILVVPDFVASAGGVITGAVEWRGGTQDEALAATDSTIRRSTRIVLERAIAEARPPREVAAALAVERVRRAAALRRFV